MNVLIFRLPKKRTLTGYSKCPSCAERIFWYDNIPVISFLFLKGRCRNCKEKISFRYPAVEIITGLLFLISFLLFGSQPVLLIYLLVLVSILIVIAFIDLKDYIIDDRLILAGFFVGGLSVVWPAKGCVRLSCSFFGSLAGLAFFGGILLLIFLVSRGKWIGLGDVKMASMLGFLLGLENSISIFYLTFLLGFLVSLVLLIFAKAHLKTKVPLGTIMSGAAIIFLLSGFDIFELLNSLILRIL